jgi:hypothetical protein
MASRIMTTTRPHLLAVVAVAAMIGRGETQPSAPTKLTVGIFAPSVDFGTAQRRLTYVQSLAKAIETNTGIETEAQSFASLGALKGAKVDFAIVDGQCYATNLGWQLLAAAEVGGETTRSWALYSSVGGDFQRLKGKKLAFVQMGCNDKAFVDNAMLESEVDDAFFAVRVGKPDLAAAVAEVAQLKGAQAVFAPSGAHKGLTKVFDTGAVPNPAFVQVNTAVSSTIADQVASAVTGFSGGGAIGGWSAAAKAPYQRLAGRMSKVVKKGVFAPPDPVRVDAKDVLLDPPTLDHYALTEVLQHVARPPERLE